MQKNLSKEQRLQLAVRAALQDSETEIFQGHFQNYFSIGIDANVTA